MADTKPHKREAAPKPSAAPAPSAAASRPAKARRASSAAKPSRKSATKAAKEGKRSPVKVVGIVVGVLAALALVAGIALAVLANTTAFTITSIDAEATEHLSAEDIASLASVPEGTTLLNYDESSIVENLRRNPWVGEVSLTRELPDRLRITVTERSVATIVMLDSGNVIWCMGPDGAWIEPMKIAVAEGQSTAEAALAVSSNLGALLVTAVPQTVNPVAGAVAEDEVFEAISEYRKELSEELWSQVVSVSAPSVEALSCILGTGVEVSFGSPNNIESKEIVVQQLLAKYPNRITYINVRVPSNPSYRMLESESVQEGTGAVSEGTSTQG